MSVTGTKVDLEPVPVSPESLDPRYVFLLDAGTTIWVWSGWKSRVISFTELNLFLKPFFKITVANKARLFAERLNKRDRKAKSEIETCKEFKTPPEFWEALTGGKSQSLYTF